MEEMGVQDSILSYWSAFPIGKGSKGTSQTPWTAYHKTLCLLLLRVALIKPGCRPNDRLGGTAAGRADLESLDPVGKKKVAPGLGLD